MLTSKAQIQKHNSCHVYVTHFTCLQKFTMEDVINMPKCNLFEMVHNIWFQQSRKKGVHALSCDFL
jgi:hypothetical protein